MKPTRIQSPLSLGVLTLGLTASLLGTAARAATFTWDGGGSDGNWSTAANWSTDTAPAAAGDNLIFAGTANTTTNNDLVTSINVGPAITFAAGAGSFNLTGNALTLGSGGGGGITIVSQQSPNPQTISANINLSGGNGDRTITFASGAGSLTLSGNIDFANDWLFPNTTAGTIILSGTNTGDGKATNAITAGTNILRAMMRNNVGGTVLTLGSDAALGNSGSGDPSLGTASLRGIIANQNMTVNTIGNRNLSGSTFAINAANITFNGSANLTIGNIINHNGNRDFVASGSGAVTVGSAYFLSADQTSRAHFLNVTGTGGVTINGPLFDTLHSGGITTRNINDTNGSPISARFRKSGSGTLTLNGNSASFTGEISLENGTTILGHPNALGATSGTRSFNLTGETFIDDPIVNMDSITGIEVGQTVTGTGIAPGTTVTAVDAGLLTITLSQAATADGFPVTLTFTGTRSAPTAVGKAPGLATLDLNGQTIAEPIHFLEGPGHNNQGVLINSNTSTPAAITTDITNVYSSTVAGPGDITVTRLIAIVARTITKNGTGTFTTNGTSHNNLCGWVLNEGTLVFANTAGLASDRGTTINAGTLRLSGPNSNLINDTQSFTMNGGTFDLNGKGEAVAAITGSAGTITNSNPTAATLFVGGGVAGTSSGSFGGVIQDGSGILHVNKEGTGTQTLTGACSYSGNTTVSNGTLSLANAFLDDDSTVTLAAGAVLDLTHSSTDVVAALIIDGVSQPAGTYNSANTSGAITGTGSIQVVPSSPAGYQNWADTYANGDGSELDSDGDGVSNGIEYFMGETNDGFTATPGIVSGAITWPKDAAFSGTYTVQTSDDLTDWTDVASTDNGSSVTYTLPVQPGPFFVRLKVTPN
ncbi:MAG: autotransporter-associated beta strand repeat-containing protein [Akkermansiaceae bacterium]|jgi:autotransporter-associated beta strand protein|nr:autotransporter-associated beta strand repeat-containing protein [Akkermansiaceae bacterium]